MEKKNKLIYSDEERALVRRGWNIGTRRLAGSVVESYAEVSCQHPLAAVLQVIGWVAGQTFPVDQRLSRCEAYERPIEADPRREIKYVWTALAYPRNGVLPEWQFFITGKPEHGLNRDDYEVLLLVGAFEVEAGASFAGFNPTTPTGDTDNA